MSNPVAGGCRVSRARSYHTIRVPVVFALVGAVLLVTSCRSVEPRATPAVPLEQPVQEPADESVVTLEPDSSSREDDAPAVDTLLPYMVRPLEQSEPVVASLPVPAIRRPDPVLPETFRADSRLSVVDLPEPRPRRPVADDPAPQRGLMPPRIDDIALPAPTVPAPVERVTPRSELPADVATLPLAVPPAEQGDTDETDETPLARSPERSAPADEMDSPATQVTAAPQAFPAPAQTRAERTVQPGRRFSITLDGAGWIYLGSTGPIEFVGRERRGGEVVFTFRAVMSDAPAAPIDLAFELQDLSSGRRSRHEERVVLLAPIGEQERDGRVSDDASEDLRAQDRVGAYEGATGGVVEMDGPLRSPVDKPLPERSTPETSVRERLDRAASAEGPVTPEEERLIQELLENPSYPGGMLALAERLRDAGDTGTAILLLESLLDTGAPLYDRILFRLASLLEQHGATRDLDRARRLYKRLIDQYPLSDYWERSTARVEYLERHFFFIR